MTFLKASFGDCGRDRFLLLVTLCEAPLMLRMVADYAGDACLQTVGLCGRQVRWGPGLCSRGVKTCGKMKWEAERKGAWAVRHFINLELELKGHLCVLTLIRRPSEPPSLSANTKRLYLLMYRSVVLEEQKSSKSGKGIWGLSPTQVLFSVTVNRSYF